MNQSTPVGKTKSQGWEIGVRRTFPISTDKAWKLLLTQPGLGHWLGHDVQLGSQKGEPYATKEGITGEIRSYNQGSLIRMTWQPPDWDFASTLQIRVTPAKKGTTISIHHEKMRSGEQRQAMHRYWSDVMDKLGELVKGQ